MNKAELKKEWGKYCDTDTLVDSIRNLLTSKNIRNSDNGVCAMLSVFFTNKVNIIEMMQNSDNYIGNLRIMVDTQMQRYENNNKINNFVGNFYNRIQASNFFLKTVDSEGNNIKDYIKVGKKKVTIQDVIDGNMPGTIENWSRIFDVNGVTLESINESEKFNNLIQSFYRYYSPVVDETLSENISCKDPTLKIAKGTKTSRAFNKVCHVYGIDSAAKDVPVKIASGAKFTDGSDVSSEDIGREYKVKCVDDNKVTLVGMNKTVEKKYLSNANYNKLFAEYSDMVSDNKRNIKFYISVNPIDYLTMSLGRSWKSCHGFGGGWFGGTVSYMLDSVSIITFVHDEVPHDFATEGKIYRNMFHYKDGLLLQSRVYPQGNDGCTDLYEEFRNIVQKEIADMLGVKNNWCAENRNNITIESLGNHYRDYRCFSNGINFSRICGTGCRNMTIGHINVCPYCGREENLSSNRIDHSSC